MENKIITAKQYFDSLKKTKIHGEFVLTETAAIQALIEFADLVHKDRLGSLLKFIEDKMELFPEDMNLSQRGAYDAYLNIRELVKAEIDNIK